MVTPAIREFLDRLERLLDGSDRPAVDRNLVEVSTTDTAARVVVPHSDPAGFGIELEIHDREVFVTWAPERQLCSSHDQALEVAAALLDGRVELVVTEHLVYRRMRSYLDGRLFLTTRMPAVTLRSSTERRRFFAP
jgi:hypothetical protein